MAGFIFAPYHLPFHEFSAVHSLFFLQVREHKFAKPFRFMPYFEHVFIGAFDRMNLHFQSDVHVRHIRAPILFLHADDDHVIPYHLCQRLYESSLKMENGEVGLPYCP